MSQNDRGIKKREKESKEKKEKVVMNVLINIEKKLDRYIAK